ncbi:MAG: hydrogenase maturation protein [Betaproteobacteria bacterium]|nr:hydrogenase maturation protein [Betaproteobacteria bacterium]
MRILLLAHAFNSLTQRLHVELTALGHEIAVEFDIHARVTEEAVKLFRPELVIAPFLKRAIPESVWRGHRCLVVHPGIRGDRGPSSLDWAVQEGETDWGVTLIQANGEMDAGDIWGWREFPMRMASKASLYRHEVTEAAVSLVLEAVEQARDPAFHGVPLDDTGPGRRGRSRPALRQSERRIDWKSDDTATILRKIRAADGVPGALDELLGLRCHLFDAHRAKTRQGGAPGEVVGRREEAVLRATVDGAVWIGHLKGAGDAQALKLPAAHLLGARFDALPEYAPAPNDGQGYRAVRYREANGVGVLDFEFYSGAMGTRQCERLARAIRYAKQRPIRVLALMGGADFWSNGIHLGLIEAAASPADESWANINAMNDLVLEILSCERQLTIAALQGNAGAGGVFLALAADRVLARRGVLLNPHYKSMGNLYGSEYWTYLLPRRVGAAGARAIVDRRLPLGAAQAASLGLVDAALPGDAAEFRAQLSEIAAELACRSDFAALIEAKRARRAADEARKPLAAYRAEELERMKRNFFGFDTSYHVARHHFIHKLPKSRTPLWLAPHRAG